MLLSEADTALVNAKSELEKAYATEMKQTFAATRGRAEVFLQQADLLVDKALKLFRKDTEADNPIKDEDIPF